MDLVTEFQCPVNCTGSTEDGQPDQPVISKCILQNSSHTYVKSTENDQSDQPFVGNAYFKTLLIHM